MWRPSDWTGLRPERLGSSFYEQGADDMLKALIKSGEYFTPEDPQYNALVTDGKTKGWIAFIPDEDTRLDNNLP